MLLHLGSHLEGLLSPVRGRMQRLELLGRAGVQAATVGTMYLAARKVPAVVGGRLLDCNHNSRGKVLTMCLALASTSCCDIPPDDDFLSGDVVPKNGGLAGQRAVNLHKRAVTNPRCTAYFSSSTLARRRRHLAACRQCCRRQRHRVLCGASVRTQAGLVKLRKTIVTNRCGLRAHSRGTPVGEHRGTQPTIAKQPARLS